MIQSSDFIVLARNRSCVYDSCMTDSPIPPNQQLVRGDRWPIVGERHPGDIDSPWSLEICGCVARKLTFSLDEIQAMPQVTRQIDVHCVTRWSKPAMSFTGVRLRDLLHSSEMPIWTDEAQFVSFVARSERNHSTSLPLSEVLELDPIIALQAEGKPLATENGGPMRMVVPGKYFYKSVKWIRRIEFLKEERLGYWESEAGYHNGADPWREERYMAPTLTKQAALRVIESRDFRGQDLRGINAAHRDLANLLASDALLRDADFRSCNLQQANFRDANLSNSKLQRSNLQGANFTGADLEGADLSGADLRGCDIRGASLFGATFFQPDAKEPASLLAIIDRSTQVDLASLDALVDEQKAFVRKAIKA
ncbi:oxidoreductase molybdopterin binding protein [Rhodopirellula baltica SH28]|uniref:Oxidoreductase molybdopterin binding protein n=1 Tax=Rhodopirellula baltica SH28 TaxID=993517 RepID=K5ECW7_RHOBT|nr:molybdopterin-dependent oxidoreductase [Rhodopirellula baltica]EKK03716.1 oxidoreductase molybdopterin binding protein [Rhodopirellula baltica SH28]